MRQTRREFLKTSAAALALGRIGMAQESKPNFVIIYTDDHGYGDVGCFGAKDLLTPNLDALARDGVRFTSWYSNSPVCSPSRASLLTGRYPSRAGVPHILGGKRGATPGLPPTEITLAKALKQVGYTSGIFGKWHLGTTKECTPNAHGFAEFFGILSGCVDYYSHIFYWGQGRGMNPLHDLWHDDREVWHNGQYLTELLTEKAVEFIERVKEPFLLYVPYNAPHYPMHAPQKYLDRFPDLTPERRIMAAMIAAVDDGVREIVKALQRKGMYENTVVFVSSDNGPSSESRNWLDGRDEPYYGGSAGILRAHKASLFEGGIRVPAIMAWPGRIPGSKVCDKVGAMMDVFPTFLDIAGARIPNDRTIDGLSILEMSNGGRSPHSEVFWEYGDQLAVRRGKWKLVLNGKLDFGRDAPDPVHLADLEADPGEIVNLKDREPALVEDLTRAANAWKAAL